MDLQTKLSAGDRIFKIFSKRCQKLGINKVEDFLYHAPSRYDNFSTISTIEQLQEGETVTIQGEVIEIKNEITKRFKKIQRAKIKDNTGAIEVIWFNQPFLLKVIKVGLNISLSGTVKRNLKNLVIQSPKYEILNALDTLHTGRLVPVYPETKGISSKWLRIQAHKILQKYKNEIEEFLPEEILRRKNYPSLYASLLAIHFPSSLKQAGEARKRLSFDEFFLMQISGLKRREEWSNQVKGIKLDVENYKKDYEDFLSGLPFELTNAQARSIKEIFIDVSSGKVMNRLLEGDVGSGKTVVAAAAIYLNHLNGFRSIVMAPTEILANQHYSSLFNFLNPLGIKLGLITGSKKLMENNPDVFVGTHALINEKVKVDNLALVVIDEQQRFGVEQRSIIRKKGNNPHFLSMTATPIPRTVALTMYGDLDVSFIDEMPKNRKQVKTWLVPNNKRVDGYKWIEAQIKEEKSQAFIICPFIEESESMTTVKAATSEFERLKREIFPNLKLGLLHGKMKGKEKDTVLNDFKEKKFDILVATPVVEVGIDIPNATIVLIEAAERFGLAQLHQLRGRVGRGEKQSYCLLFTGSASPLTTQRLKSLEKIYFGPELAELDLKLRGPGQLFGTIQSGVPKLKMGSFSDFNLIKEAQEEARKIFPDLSKYPVLKKKIDETINYLSSPD